MKVKATKKVTKKSPSKKVAVKKAVGKPSAKEKAKIVVIEKKMPQAPISQKTPDVKIKTILLAQQKPESDKNPYTDIAKKHKVEIDFKPFIHLESVDAITFRKLKINPTDFQAVILTSRNTIDHFFKLCDDLRVKMHQDTKYYCMTEAIALYMQKYILYRKRKVFFGDGTFKGLCDSIIKHRDGEKYLIPCADMNKSEIGDFLAKQKFFYKEATILNTVPVKLTTKELNKYDMIAFFSPTGVKALLHNIPDYKQGKKIIGGFGPQTTQAIINAKLRLDIKAPVEGVSSMSMAIDRFLSKK